MYYKVPLLLEPQPEGGYTVTSPLLPELTFPPKLNARSFASAEIDG
jgi:hypothetical protein